MAQLFAGTSGFAYTAWKPEFYPQKVASKDFLKYYATRLNTVEINYTFRQLPKAATLENWVNATPGRLCVRLQGAHADHAPLPVGPGPSTRPPRPPDAAPRPALWPKWPKVCLSRVAWIYMASRGTGRGLALSIVCGSEWVFGWGTVSRRSNSTDGECRK